MSRLIFRLAQQACGWNDTDQRLTVVQRWTGFTAGREALAIVTNGVVTTQQAGQHKQVQGRYDSVALLIRPHTVTEGRARDRLEQLGLPRACHCPDCQQPLPIGGLYCVGCGLPAGIHTAAATTTTAREAATV